VRNQVVSMKAMDLQVSRVLGRFGLGLGAVLTCWMLVAAPPVQSASDRELRPAKEALAKDDLNEAHRLLEALHTSQPNDADINVLLGETHWRRGEMRDAREHFEKARSADANDARALAGLALVAISQDDLEQAESLARAAVDRNKKLWMANFAMGRVLLAQGKPDEAFEYLEKGKDTKNRADGRDLFEEGMGLLALAERDVEGAETNLIRARALAPNTVEHVMSLAAMYESTGQWGQAASVLEDMAAKIGKSPQLSYRLGRAYENLRRWNDALREYQATLQADSTYAPALAALGHIYLLDTSKTPYAVNLLSRAVELRPTPQAQLDLGIALTRQNRAAEAIPHLEAAVAADPTPEAKLAMVRAYLQGDQAQKGLALFESDVDVRIEASASDLTQAAASLIQAKDYEKARAYLDQAEEKDPEYAEIAYRRGLISLYEKDYAGAIQQFQKKLAKEPQSASAWMNLAIAHQGNRDPESAAEAYQKVTELAPNSQQAWTQYGDVLSGLEKRDEAKAAYDRALQLDGGFAGALKGRGFLYLVSGQYPQAIADLRQATTRDPQDAQAWAWLGTGLLNSGSQQEAEVAFRKALALDPNNESAQEGLNALQR
jgi:tetratricopeptide (TPR) repeat protein